MADAKILGGPFAGSLVMPVIGTFVAGFVSILIFHQAMFELLHLMELVSSAPYNMSQTRSLGVPIILALAIFGGLWAFPIALLISRQSMASALLIGLAFGAIVPTLVDWFLFSPLRSPGSVFAAGITPRLLVSPAVNGAFGFGTALIMTLLPVGYRFRRGR